MATEHDGDQVAADDPETWMVNGVQYTDRRAGERTIQRYCGQAAGHGEHFWIWDEAPMGIKAYCPGFTFQRVTPLEAPITDVLGKLADDTEQLPRVDENVGRTPGLSIDAQHVSSPNLLTFGQPLELVKGDNPILGIHDDKGRSLVEFRIRNGKVEARYYDSDLDEAARFFIQYLMELHGGNG